MKHSYSHTKAESILRSLGWSPLRQFTPRKADICIKGEHFELWRNGPGNKTLMLHLYGDDGCEFYPVLGAGNSWADVEKKLGEVTK